MIQELSVATTSTSSFTIHLLPTPARPGHHSTATTLPWRSLPSVHCQTHWLILSPHSSQHFTWWVPPFLDLPSWLSPNIHQQWKTRWPDFPASDCSLSLLAHSSLSSWPLYTGGARELANYSLWTKLSFYEQNFIRMEPCPAIGQSWVTATDTTGPTMPKVFSLWPEEYADPWPKLWFHHSFCLSWLTF